MPELPEVETTRRGILPIKLKTVSNVVIRQPKLRWLIPATLPKQLIGHPLQDIDRRGKYLLLKFSHGTMLIHLGMSGCLRLVNPTLAALTHDHVDIIFNDELCLRFNDPRRFGSVLWTSDDPLKHKLLTKLGPEPLGKAFNTDYLYQSGCKRRIAIKTLLMNSHIVVGVGNIYANEALFMAGISPKRMANKISYQRYCILVKAIKAILKSAIRQGGTTLKDFYRADGKPGYFRNKLLVYNREQQPCTQCNNPIRRVVQNQRATYYCSCCQT